MDLITPFAPKSTENLNGKKKELDRQIEDSINELNFEKAEELYQQKLKISDNFQDEQATHYQEEINKYKARNEAYHEEKIAENQQIYEKRIEECKEKYAKIFEEIAERQNIEIAKLKQEWIQARETTKKKVNENIEKQLETSKSLAKSHRTAEAIRVRDKALAMRETTDLPEFVEINNDYKRRFAALLDRQRTELTTHHILYQQDVDSIYEESIAANKIVETSKRTEATKIPLNIMKTAINCDGVNPGTIKVIKMVSPRSTKKVSCITEGSRSPNKYVNHSEKDHSYLG